jgi:osmotically-inducible protein OsmY
MPCCRVAQSAFLSALLASLLAAGCSAGYRSEEDSRDLRRDLDDRTIESRVRIALGRDPETAEERIEIGCRDGVVTLRGTVSRDAAADRATSTAAGVEGVRRVVDRITRPSASD